MTMPILQLVSIMLTAVAMSAGWAHLLELPAKMKLSREDYLTVHRSTGAGRCWESWWSLRLS